MKRTVLTLAAVITGLLLGFGIFLVLSFRHSLPDYRGELRFVDLAEDVRIVRDRWAVPHVFAGSERDLFFAVGFFHAQERMWQMDLLRRAGFGRLSEIFGPRALETDRFLRSLGLREAALKDYENLRAADKDLLAAYCRGVNSWLSSRRFDWPPEFLLLRYRPETWSILDSVIIKEVLALTLCEDLQGQLLRAKLVARCGMAKALEILEKDAVPPKEEIPRIRPSRAFFRSLVGGSNNWVLAGSRTESGKPLLANDPHLEITLPPIWYEAHLHCPGINVVGVNFPGFPLIVIGHNDAVAWGLTNSAADVQDVCVEKLNEAGDSYWDLGAWKSLRKEVEWIRVRGRKEPERTEVWWTERGPLLPAEKEDEKVRLSLRWTIHEGGRIYESLYRLNKARNWEDFCAAASLWDAPSQNFVYADIQGNIGYYLSGRIPVRDRAAALYPSAGWKEENQWRGYLSEEQKPTVLNPERGYIVTANHKVVPPSYPFYVSCAFDYPFRAQRIEELIERQERHSVESLKKIQNDVFSGKAALFLPLLKNLSAAQGKAARALEILRDWDGQMAAGKEAALFAVFLRILEREIFADELGEEQAYFSSLFSRAEAGTIRILSDPASGWFDRSETAAVESRDDILKASLASAYEWLEKTSGPEEQWDWMNIHALKYRHALGRVPLLRFLNRGPYPLDGDSFCVRASFSPPLADFSTTHGVSYRQIIDLADFRKSVCVVSSGQSGHFLSRHYDDQIPLWLKGDYRPMLFAAEDIEANASAVLFLRPSAGTD